jgi:4'-phosphopantetheinyl transferase
MQKTIGLWCAAPETVLDRFGRPACETLLDAGERERWKRLRFDADRDLYLAAHALLRNALTASHPSTAPEEWEFGRDEGGKPVLSGPGARTDLRFNLSHTSGLVAVGVAAGVEVGVDVEDLSRDMDDRRLARRFFTTEEAALLDGAPPAQRPRLFCALWTLREAYLKASGIGLGKTLSSLHFRLGGGTIGFADDALGPIEARRWEFVVLDAGDRHRLAVAAKRSEGMALRVEPGTGGLGGLLPQLRVRAATNGMTTGLPCGEEASGRDG